MSLLPEVVTHRYDPARGMCRNLCSLEVHVAEELLETLRRQTRPTLKPNYLERRRAVESWLSKNASIALGRDVRPHPAYFFLGDFSFFPDLSRPSSLLLKLRGLPECALTFSLGDSMTVAAQPGSKLYTLSEVEALNEQGALLSFGFSDRGGFQRKFVEMQWWEPPPSSKC